MLIIKAADLDVLVEAIVMRESCFTSRVSPALAEGLNFSSFSEKVIALLTPLECSSSSLTATARRLPKYNLQAPSTGFIGV